MCTEHHETSPPSINGSGPREVALGRPQNSEREASGILGQVDVNDGDTVTVLECQAPTILAKRWCSDGEIQGYSKAKNLKPAQH